MKRLFEIEEITLAVRDAMGNIVKQFVLERTVFSFEDKTTTINLWQAGEFAGKPVVHKYSLDAVKNNTSNTARLILAVIYPHLVLTARDIKSMVKLLEPLIYWESGE